MQYRVVMKAAVFLLAPVVALAGCRSKPEEPAPKPTASGEASERALKVNGIEVQVPRTMISLEADRVERLEQAAQREQPSAKYTIKAVRDPSSMIDGTVYVHRSDITRPLTPGFSTVREALAANVAETAQFLSASGARIVHTDQKERDGGIEVCYEAQMSGGPGKVAALHVCTLFYLHPEERLRGLTVNCMSAPGEPLCPRVLSTRKYAPDAAMALDAKLSPVIARGLAGMEKRRALGVTFGMTRAAFVASCRKARRMPDEYDWAVEDPIVRSWLEKGLVSKCSGPLAASDWIDVVETHVRFHEDQVVSMTVFASNEQADLERKLGDAYPDSGREHGRSIHLVDRNATGLEIVSIGVGPSSIPKGRSSLTVLTRDGMAAPALL